VRKVCLSLSAAKGEVEFATVGKDAEGKIFIRLWNAAEIDKFLEENELAEKKDENAMQD